MKKFILMLAVITGFAACSNSDSSAPGSPTAALDNMFTAMKNGKMDDMKKFISKADVAFMESLEKIGNSIDSEQVKKMKAEMSEEFRKKVKDVTYTLKNEKIDGDNASVEAEITDGGKTESHNFELVKEDGNWKISLTKGNGMFNSMKGNMGPERRDLQGDLEKLKNMDKDSLKMLMDSLQTIMHKNN